MSNKKELRESPLSFQDDVFNMCMPPPPSLKPLELSYSLEILLEIFKNDANIDYDMIGDIHNQEGIMSRKKRKIA